MSAKLDNILPIPVAKSSETEETVFSSGRYRIPLYQRAFSWKEKEITQLIDDIDSYEADRYYLGSLIVNYRHEDDVFEVIDGQQRLTALFLLLDYLEYAFDRGSLTFECREKSNYTLKFLSDLCDEKKIEVQYANSEKVDQELLHGWKIIENKFRTENLNRQDFKNKLHNVWLFRIEVPPHTDLNRYFEIMNVRGEQLEQHDVLKAKLMEALSETEREVFALVWDACREMTGYVQMHFPKSERAFLFGNNWNRLTSNEIFSLFSDHSTAEEKNVLEIISNVDRPRPANEKEAENDRVRFESIIDFPHFLLHVLKVFVSKDQKISEILPELLDDKKLLKVFTNVLNSVHDKRNFAKEFVRCLLKLRFLFDKYIIKREYKNEDSDGDWSLKELKVYNGRSKKAEYVDTCFNEHREWGKTYQPRTRKNLMLQACLRVSYTSPKNMHWITELLKWLYQDENLSSLSQFEKETEKVIQQPVRVFLDAGDYCLGVRTPHIIFNYLDYLLWTHDKKSDFTFEYRTSVEHWYPRHPSEQSFPRWDDVDRFGNLCIIRRDVNSKFSNLSPKSKLNTYKELVDKGSLKLRSMRDSTESDEKWCEKDCAEHEAKMLNILQEACSKE